MMNIEMRFKGLDKMKCQVKKTQQASQPVSGSADAEDDGGVIRDGTFGSASTSCRQVLEGDRNVHRRRVDEAEDLESRKT